MHAKLAEAHKLISQGHALLAEAHFEATDKGTPTPEPDKKTKTKKDAAPATPPPLPTQAAAAPAAPEPALISIDKVRDAALKAAGNPAFGPEKVKALLAQFEAGRVSDLKETAYPMFLKALEAAQTTGTDFI